MAPTPSIKVTKSFTYKGGTKQFSNRYHFDGGNVPDASHWLTLANSITDAEKAIYSAAVTIVSVTGYDAGSEVPVYTNAYSLAGTGAFSGAQLAPGDAAALLRYTTTQRTSKNHPIYLFNYFHGACFATSSPPDVLYSVQKTAIETYATSWLTGFSDGTNTHHRAGPNGAVAQTRLVETYITHRDFRN